MDKEKEKWETPQLESLEINAPQKCNKPWEQVDVCNAQQEPYDTIPCVPASKGTPLQALS